MQDNISCALITAFERQYDTSWDDPKLRNERLAMRYGWTAAMEAKQCLHQIQEPAAAEQAAWHAGLDEGRAQAVSSQRAMVRYCPECGHIGEVGAGHRDCCPDGSQAFMVPEKHAEGLRTGFLARITKAAPAAVAVSDELIRAAKQALACMDGLQQHLGRAVCQVEADALRAALAATPAATASEVQLHPSRAGRVYVAGPMTGLPDFNFPAFTAAAAGLRAKGWHVENPAEHGIVDGAEWADYLHYDLGRLATCAAMYLLPGWSQSRGATLEVHVATTLGMTLFYAEGAEIYRQPSAAAAPVVLPEPAPTPCRSMFATQREYADAMAQHRKNWAEVEAERALLATATGLPAQAVADEVHCVCGASWLRHGVNDYEMTDTPRKAQASGDANG